MSDIDGGIPSSTVGTETVDGGNPLSNQGTNPAFRWTFYDEATGELYTFENNPHDASPQQLQKNVTPYPLSADDGYSVLYEGMDTPIVSTFTISVLTQTFYQALLYWYSKRRQILMTDDLGNTTWIYFTFFTPTRKYTTQHPWSHDVVMQYLVLGQQGVTTL